MSQWAFYTTGWRGYALTLLAGMVLALGLVAAAILADDLWWVHQQHQQYRAALAQRAAKQLPSPATPPKVTETK